MPDCPAYPADIQEAEARGFRKGIEAAAQHLERQAMNVEHQDGRRATMLRNKAVAIRVLEPK